MAKTLVVLIAVAITLGASVAARAQPQPDPAPVPKPAPASPAPSTSAPAVTPTTGGGHKRKDRTPRKEKRRPAKPQPPERRAAEIVPAAVQLARLEAGPATAVVTSAITSTPSATVASSAPVASDDSGLPPAAGFALILFLAAVLLALAFAAIPERVLSAVSVRLAESRKDIGLALVLATAAGALISLVLLGAWS